MDCLEEVTHLEPNLTLLFECVHRLSCFRLHIRLSQLQDILFDTSVVFYFIFYLNNSSSQTKPGEIVQIGMGQDSGMHVMPQFCPVAWTQSAIHKRVSAVEGTMLKKTQQTCACLGNSKLMWKLMMSACI